MQGGGAGADNNSGLAFGGEAAPGASSATEEWDTKNPTTITFTDS